MIDSIIMGYAKRDDRKGRKGGRRKGGRRKGGGRSVVSERMGAV